MTRLSLSKSASFVCIHVKADAPHADLPTNGALDLGAEAGMTISTSDAWQSVPVVDLSAATRRRLVRWLLVIGFVSGLFYVLSPHFSDVQQFDEEERIAIHLAHGDGFLSPFDLSSSSPPTSWCPPVYPGVVGGIYRLLGVRSDAALMTMLALQVACRMAAAVAIFLIGTAWFSRSAGTIAAALLLLHPLFLRALGFYWDNYLALAMFLWLLAWAIHLGRKRASLFEAGNLGFAMGVLILTNTAYALTLPLLTCIAGGVGAGWNNPQPPPTRRGARGLAGIVCMTALAGVAMLSPWTLRNYLAFDRVFFVRANLNTELWIGNVPESTGWMSLKTLDHHPSRNPAECRELLAAGEIKYFQNCGRRFSAEYRADPGRFWLLCYNRIVYAFVGSPYSQVRYPLLPNIRIHEVMIDRLLLNLALAAIAAAGIIRAWWAGSKPGAMLLLLGCLAVAPYTVTQMYDRYTIPLNALLLLPAADLLALLVARARSNSTQPTAKWAALSPAMPQTNL